MKQKELFEEQGIQGAFGIKQLGSIGRLYPADATVQASFMALVSAYGPLVLATVAQLVKPAVRRAASGLAMYLCQ